MVYWLELRVCQLSRTGRLKYIHTFVCLIRDIDDDTELTVQV